MPRGGFEPATPATKRPQTYALYHAANQNNYHSLIVAINVI
jgi:hypothetical protein